MGLKRISTAELTPKGHANLAVVLLLLMLMLANWGGSPSVMTSRAEVGQNWSLDADGNDIDDLLDDRIAGGDDGPWVVDIHYTRATTATDESVLTVQHGVEHLYRYHNWNQEILAFVDVNNVDGIADMVDVYGVELRPELAFDPLPNETLETNASVHALRVREYPLIADGYDHNDAVVEDLNFTGRGVVIAIMDSGVDNNHVALDDMDDDPNTDDPKLVQRIGKNGSVRYAAMQAKANLGAINCAIDPPDDWHHGTAVAGLALGTSGGGSGMPGMASGARMVDISVRDGGIFSDLDLTGAYARALDFVLLYNQGNSCYGPPGNDTIDILQISLGIAADPKRFPFEQLTNITRSGITIVMSAGNSQNLVNAVEGAIIVGNANISQTVNRADDVLHWSSSRGPRLLSDGDTDEDDERMPHVTAPGEYVLAPLFNSVTGYFPFRGTSSAAPHVSGVAALMLEANDKVHPVDQGSLEGMGDPWAVPIRDLLIQSAQYKEAQEAVPGLPEPDPFEGEPGMFNHTWNKGWGYGLVDAYNATVAALNYQP